MPMVQHDDDDGLVLRHNNHYRLFNAKSLYINIYIYIYIYRYRHYSVKLNQSLE